MVTENDFFNKVVNLNTLLYLNSVFKEQKMEGFGYIIKKALKELNQVSWQKIINFFKWQKGLLKIL